VIRVLRRNPLFARLWLAQIVSQAGDWLDRVACFVLIGELGGASARLGLGVLFGVEQALRLVPTAVVGPLAGPVADRWSRRKLMIAADLSRAVVVLGFLLVRDPAHLPLLYALVVLQMGIGIFFEAARSAAVPDTVSREELHDAYAVMSATWSLTLCLGSMAGGWLVSWIGVRGAFVVDAGTYVASAIVLLRLRLPPMPHHEGPFRWKDVVLLSDLARAGRHARERGVAAAVWVKTFWGAAGGYLVLLTLAGRERFGESGGSIDDIAVATGALFAARGVGTGFGPLLAGWFSGRSDAALRRQVTGGFLLAVFGYTLFGFAPGLTAACVAVAVAHLGGSALWVASTVLWQRGVADAWRGRVYALESLGASIAFASGGLLAGWAFDRTGSIPTTAWIVSGLVLVLGAAWAATARAEDASAGRRPAP